MSIKIFFYCLPIADISTYLPRSSRISIFEVSVVIFCAVNSSATPFLGGKRTGTELLIVVKCIFVAIIAPLWLMPLPFFNLPFLLYHLKSSRRFVYDFNVFSVLYLLFSHHFFAILDFFFLISKTCFHQLQPLDMCLA